MKTYIIPGETMEAIKERDFTVCDFTSKGRFYTCYSKVMQYLLSDSPVLVNRETNSPEQVERIAIFDVYSSSFEKGRKKFKDLLKPHTTDKFLIDKFNEHYNGWKRTSEALSLMLNKSQVEAMGLAAGHRLEFVTYLIQSDKFNLLVEDGTIQQSDSDIYNRVKYFEDKKGIDTSADPKNFTGNKLIDIYDPKAIHKEFKKELKCDFDTFKAWFVDGIIYEKQMDWRYKGGNKTQLRSFIYMLTYGWKPSETNLAFKLKVDSNDREQNLSVDLLRRIKECKK